MEQKAKRVTIMIDVEVDKKIRALQAAKIRETNGTCSFSTALNDVLLKGLQKGKKRP